jgi:tRNA (cytidine/uridine-2'-O-)-methyltransferase
MALRVALYEPEIPWNTGNIGRTCVAAGATLHLIGRLGFDLSEKEIRRSGMDYWPKLDLKLHESLDAFEAQLRCPLIVFSTKGRRALWDAPLGPDCAVLFGRESSGLPASVLERHKDAVYRIPIREEARSLNLSTAAAVVIYEAMRRARS